MRFILAQNLPFSTISCIYKYNKLNEIPGHQNYDGTKKSNCKLWWISTLLASLLGRTRPFHFVHLNSFFLLKDCIDRNLVVNAISPRPTLSISERYHQAKSDIVIVDVNNNNPLDGATILIKLILLVLANVKPIECILQHVQKMNASSQLMYFLLRYCSMYYLCNNLHYHSLTLHP